MIPDPDDLIGDWTGLIVHVKYSTAVNVKVKGIQEDGSLYGSYSFPKSKPREKGGNFTGELYGSWLFIRITDYGKIHFHVHIVGKDRPDMMYGAIPRANGKTPHATLTIFPIEEEPIVGLWQTFLLEGS